MRRKIGSTSITIQTAGMSQSEFKQFCFQSDGVMQNCTFPRKGKNKICDIKFKQIFKSLQRTNKKSQQQKKPHSFLSDQTCPNWHLGLYPKEIFQKLSMLNPNHCPNFQKASKIMENFLKVTVLCQGCDVALSEIQGLKFKILCSFCWSSTKLMSNLSKDTQE